MTTRERRDRRLIFFAVAILVTASVVGAVVFSKAKKQEQRERVSTMPPVYSKLKNLEVVNATIIDPGTAAARVSVEIRNNSDLDVTSVDLVSGEGAVTKSGFIDPDHPAVVIPARGTTTVQMNFGEMTPGAPLVVSAVTYADGTEEGDQSSLQSMRATRDHDRAEIKAKKEKQIQKEGATP